MAAFPDIDQCRLSNPSVEVLIDVENPTSRLARVLKAREKRGMIYPACHELPDANQPFQSTFGRRTRVT